MSVYAAPEFVLHRAPNGPTTLVDLAIGLPDVVLAEDQRVLGDDPAMAEERPVGTAGETRLEQVGEDATWQDTVGEVPRAPQSYSG